jgi:glycosyltransferase involved in cell wall biosynthesis
LRNAITSLQKLNFPKDRYEIVVIDNNSTDDTRRIVEECKQHGNKEIIYFKEVREGLHNARHAGARIATGDILAYIDDDVISEPDWLSELIKPYADPEVACVGGKILPRYETKEPEWAKYFPGFLSILDRANDITTINDDLVYGCNFSIRKTVLYDVGGFHPDAMPWNLIKYRGDGETGLLNQVMGKKNKVVYTPFAVVTHVIPKERVTTDYFKRRAFIQGITNSYVEIRKNRKVSDSIKDNLWYAVVTKRLVKGYFQYLLHRQTKYALYAELAQLYFFKGKKYHQREVMRDPLLMTYVVQESYF